MKSYIKILAAFVLNILMVYVAYAICRAAYLFENWDAFSKTFTDNTLWTMFCGTLMFDTSAIMYTNVLYAVMLLLAPPLDNAMHHAAHRTLSMWWMTVAKWMFIIVNSICMYVNLADAVYFKFTGRRTTMSVLQEFSNENNIQSVFGVELINHWYLVLLGLLLTAMLIVLYRHPRGTERFLPMRWNGARLIALRLVGLLLFVPLCIGGMRGGLSHAVRPITISNANQYVNSPAEASLVLNTPFSMIRTLSKKSFVDPEYFDDEQLAQIYTPVKTPANTSVNTPVNIVVLIVESFAREYIGALNDYQGYTPEMDKLIEKSLTFEYSYANGRKSIDGMPSVLSSIPMFVEPFFLTPSSMNDISGIAGELGKVGYHSAFFHGAENGSMGFMAFSRSSGFDEYYGQTEYVQDKRFHGMDDYDGMWAIWDEPFLQYYALKMTEMQQPFMTAVFTASSHHPFNIPDKYKPVYKDDGKNPIHKCIRYTDHALGQFFRTASQQPWFKNTIFVLTSDHTNIPDHPEYETALGVYSAPIVIYDPSGCIKPGRSKSIAQQIDIMPTLLNHIGYDKPYVAFGKDLLHTPAEDTWAVNYNNGIYQLVKGNRLIQFDGQKVTGVYDFRKDKLLKHPLPLPKDGDADVMFLKAIIQQYMHRMVNNELVVRNK